MLQKIQVIGVYLREFVLMITLVAGKITIVKGCFKFAYSQFVQYL